MVPVAPAGWNVWHEAQPFDENTDLPAAAFPPPPPPPPEEVVVAGVVFVDEVVVDDDVEPDTVTVCTTVAGDFPSDV